MVQIVYIDAWVIFFFKFSVLCGVTIYVYRYILRVQSVCVEARVQIVCILWVQFVYIYTWVNFVHPAGTICVCRYSECPGVQFVHVDVRAKFVLPAGTICVYK